MPTSAVEMQVTHYVQGQEYKPHVDFYPSYAKNLSSNRKSTFYAILDASCSHCGTTFPMITKEWDDARWCKHMDCDEPVLTTQAVPGNALFWENMDVNNTGNYQTIHAGMPLPSGVKIGLNIWTHVAVNQENEENSI